MKKSVLFIVLSILLVSVSAGQKGQPDKKREFKDAEKAVYNELDAKYQNFLNMITYITYAEERKVFLKLTNDRDRDAFVTIFWLQRDPTPGTPENEYKNEIEKRFAYVNDIFKRGSPRPGWMTDQGRMYMILGKPNSQERFDEKPGLYPVQVWYYFGDSSLGLPTYFNIVFYKKHGAGEWKLYSPASDGPASLLIQESPMDTDDYLTIYKKIYEIAPSLAGPSISMIPNEITDNYRPSLRSNFILANIFESPTKRLNVSYATNFLKYKGYVNIESSANFIENSNLVSVTRDERYGCNFVNVSVRPKKISLGFNEDKDKYFFNLNLNVSLRQAEKIVYQYAKNFEFYFAPDKVEGLARRRGSGPRFLPGDPRRLPAGRVHRKFGGQGIFLLRPGHSCAPARWSSRFWPSPSSASRRKSKTTISSVPINFSIKRFRLIPSGRWDSAMFPTCWSECTT